MAHRWLVIASLIILSTPGHAFEEEGLPGAPETPASRDLPPVVPIPAAPQTIETDVPVSPRIARDVAPSASSDSVIEVVEPAYYGYEPAPLEGRVGLAMNNGNFGGRAALHVPLVPMVSFAPEVSYASFALADGLGNVQHRVDLFGRAELDNPTLIKPFVAAGPGYASWRQWTAKMSAPATGTLTLAAAIGCQLRLSRLFQLRLERSATRYLGRAPYADARLHARPQIARATMVQFEFVF